MRKKALVVLANGMEEVEAVTPIDILRRAGVEVIIAGLGSDVVKGGHGLEFGTDILFDEYEGVPDALVLPGGQPGAEHLSSSVKLKNLITKMNGEGRVVAAICASPALVLAPTGVLDGKKAVCYPGLENNFRSNVKYVNTAVVQDGNVITAKGPGTAFEFGLKIVENLEGKAKAAMLAEQMVYGA